MYEEQDTNTSCSHHTCVASLRVNLGSSESRMLVSKNNAVGILGSAAEGNGNDSFPMSQVTEED